MNFFGHAAVASRFESSPFVFGAMLPDFLGMLRLRAPGVTLPDWDVGRESAESTGWLSALRRGYAFHHATDHAFHELPSFQHATREAFARLQAAGLARGPARALAHIGIELLIDETPEMKRLGTDAYLAALSDARGRTALLAPLWSDLDRARLETLLDTLRARGVRSERVSESDMSDRLRRILSGRPRLAFSEQEGVRVRDWVTQTRPEMAVRIVPLLAELWSALEREGLRPTMSYC